MVPCPSRPLLRESPNRRPVTLNDSRHCPAYRHIFENAASLTMHPVAYEIQRFFRCLCNSTMPARSSTHPISRQEENELELRIARESSNSLFEYTGSFSDLKRVNSAPFVSTAKASIRYINKYSRQGAPRDDISPLYSPTNTAARRSTKDCIPSLAS